MTARNIYYRDPALFKSQHVVDRYVDILAFTLGVRRANLNVVSSLSPPCVRKLHSLTCKIIDGGSKRSGDRRL